jgi:glycosyltransferase involved in cell wall biosynthesis
MKVSLAHDSFTQLGGAERVLGGIHELFPDSPVYTAVMDRKVKNRFSGWDIRTSPLQFLYNIYPHFQHLFAFVPAALSFMRVKDTGLLLSSGSSFIKGLKVPVGSLHVDYCHTPTRFLWSDRNYALSEIPTILRPLAKFYFVWLRRWDLKAASRVDFFIANSKEVQKRITKYYGRDSTIIHPFLDTEFWRPTIPKQNYFLIAGRLQPYKNNDVVIKLFNELGWELHVVGTGRQEQYLKSIAKSNVKFFGRLSDEGLRDQYSGAKAFISPQLEDFGMMPLEAASCGTATIGLDIGGTLETVIPAKTGELFDRTNAAGLENVIRAWDENRYVKDDLIAHARNFSKSVFQKQLLAYLDQIQTQQRS